MDYYCYRCIVGHNGVLLCPLHLAAPQLLAAAQNAYDTLLDTGFSYPAVGELATAITAATHSPRT